MNLQSCFESCLSQRKISHLHPLALYVSFRFQSPALRMQHTQWRISAPHIYIVLWPLLNLSSLLPDKHSHPSLLPSPLVQIFRTITCQRRGTARHQWQCCVSVPHPGTAGTIPEKETELRTFCPFSVFTCWLRLSTRLLPTRWKSAPLTTGHPY